MRCIVLLAIVLLSDLTACARPVVRIPDTCYCDHMPKSDDCVIVICD